MTSARNTELRVGLFVMAAIVIGGITAFVIGQQRNVFDRFVEYRAIFRDAEGIRKGNTVRIAGLTAGSVTDVAFSRDGRVEITFSVAERFTMRIRGVPGSLPDREADVPQPSRVTIGSKGMLGDKLLDVSAGDMRLPEWPHAQPLPVGSSGGLMEAAGRAMGDLESTARNVRAATDPLRDQQFTHDLQRVAANLASISTDLAEGDGTLGRLLRDPELGQQTEETLRNLRTATQELASTSRSVRQIADEVRTGDGSAHRLIYGDEAANAAGNIGDAAGEVAIALRTIREGNGTLHGLMYGNEGGDLIANLTRASEDLAHISADMRAGRGTIGGLLVDPSIYEDVKRLVGDLQRNDILRALVRYSIRRDDATTDVDVRGREQNVPAPREEAPSTQTTTEPAP